MERAGLLRHALPGTMALKDSMDPMTDERGARVWRAIVVDRSIANAKSSGTGVNGLTIARRKRRGLLGRINEEREAP